MYDTAHNASQELLNSLEIELDKMYSDEYKHVIGDIRSQLKGIYFDNENATQKQRLKYANQGDKLNKLVFFIVTAYLLVNEKALKKTNIMLENVYKINRQWAINEIAEAVQSDLKFRDVKFNLSRIQNRYDRRAYNRLADEKFLSDVLIKRLKKSIKNGDKIELMERRLRGGIAFSRNSSLDIARTETTRIENYARYQTYLQAKSKGVDIKKMWVSVLDGNTRRPPKDDADHYDLFGEIKELEEYFSNGLLIPGDRTAPAKEVINCRCRIVAVIYIDGKEVIVNGILDIA